MRFGRRAAMMVGMLNVMLRRWWLVQWRVAHRLGRFELVAVTRLVLMVLQQIDGQIAWVEGSGCARMMLLMVRRWRRRWCWRHARHLVVVLLVLLLHGLNVCNIAKIIDINISSNRKYLVSNTHLAAGDASDDARTCCAAAARRQRPPPYSARC